MAFIFVRMQMKTRIERSLIIVCFLVVLPIFTTLTSNQPSLATHSSSPLMLGSLQFPQTVTHMPTPRIYFLGKTIPCEIHQSERKITFDLPKQRSCRELYLLITEAIDYTLKKSALFEDMQTIDHIKVPDGQEYKFYQLTLAQDPENHEQFFWSVTQQILPQDSRRIPDETVIVLYTPDYVQTVVGG